MVGNSWEFPRAYNIYKGRAVHVFKSVTEMCISIALLLLETSAVEYNLITNLQIDVPGPFMRNKRHEQKSLISRIKGWPLMMRPKGQTLNHYQRSLPEVSTKENPWVISDLSRKPFSLKSNLANILGPDALILGGRLAYLLRYSVRLNRLSPVAREIIILQY